MNKPQQFLRMRRSIRRFKRDPVPASVVDTILRTATFAPSAHNLQPWRFVKISSDLAKVELGHALLSKLRADMKAKNTPQVEIEKRVKISLRRIEEAPIIILLCRDQTILREDTSEEKIMAVQSTAVAGLQLLLAAQAEGLSGNWVCWVLYAQDKIIDALKLPKSWLPEAMFFLGYANGKPKKANRHPSAELTITR